MHSDSKLYPLLCHMKRKIKTRDKTSRGKMSHFMTFYPFHYSINNRAKTRGKMSRVKCRSTARHVPLFANGRGNSVLEELQYICIYQLLSSHHDSQTEKIFCWKAPEK